MTTTAPLRDLASPRPGTLSPRPGTLAVLPALALLAAALLAGCGSTPSPEPASTSAPVVEEAEIAADADLQPPEAPEPVVVGELWETERRPEEGLDAVAVWPGAGDRAWLIATAHATHRLVIFDAATGELLRELGGAGDGPGQFQRPEALAVVDDLLFVAEGGNARVQVLRLPGLASLGFVDLAAAEQPSGVAAVRRPGGGYEVVVTQDGPPGTGAAAGERRFRIDLRDGRLESAAIEPAPIEPGAIELGAIGLADDPAGRFVPPGAGSPEAGTVMDTAADLGVETRPEAAADLGAGTIPGPLSALYTCPGGGGYRVVADAGSDPTRFRLLDRATGQLAAAFTGRRTANTSGLWLSQVPLPDLPAGALYAVHDGQSVTVFDWRDVAAATGVRADCVLEGK